MCDRGYTWQGACMVGAYVAGGVHGRGRGPCMVGGVHGRRERPCQLLRDIVNEQAVRILLECILVSKLENQRYDHVILTHLLH